MSYEPPSYSPPPPPMSPPPAWAPPPTGGGGGDAARKVSGPAIALMVLGALDIVGALLGLVSALFMKGLFPGMGGLPPGMDTGQLPPELMRWIEMSSSGAFQIVSAVIQLGIGAIIIFAGLMMKGLKSWGLALCGAILAVIPCLHGCPCCLLGLGFGIWALVVLFKPEVKAAFS